MYCTVFYSLYLPWNELNRDNSHVVSILIYEIWYCSMVIHTHPLVHMYSIRVVDSLLVRDTTCLFRQEYLDFSSLSNFSNIILVVLSLRTLQRRGHSLIIGGNIKWITHELNNPTCVRCLIRLFFFPNQMALHPPQPDLLRFQWTPTPPFFVSWKIGVSLVVGKSRSRSLFTVGINCTSPTEWNKK